MAYAERTEDDARRLDEGFSELVLSVRIITQDVCHNALMGVPSLPADPIQYLSSD